MATQCLREKNLPKIRNMSSISDQPQIPAIVIITVLHGMINTGVDWNGLLLGHLEVLPNRIRSTSNIRWFSVVDP